MNNALTRAVPSLPTPLSAVAPIKRALLVLAGLLLLFGTMGPDVRRAHAAPADSITVDVSDSGEIAVNGSSNVRAWTMEVESFRGTVVLGEEEENGAIPSIQSINVTVPVEELVADRSSMQDKAHKALKKKDHPDITFAADEVTTSESQDGSFAVSATGDLTIAGETKTVELNATAARQDDGTYAVGGEHDLKLSTFDVERPSAMFGALKVTDEIEVEFDVVLPAPSE